MEKITSITKEQEAQITVYIDKFIKKASKPIDRSNIKELSKKIWGEEKIVIVGESLQNTIDLIKFATKGEKIEYKSSQLRNQLGSQLGSQLDSQLGNQLDSQLDSQLDRQLYSQLDNQLDNQLYNQLYNQLGNQLGNQLRNQLYNQLDKQLHSQLHSQLYNQLDSQLDNQLYSQLYNQLGNQLGIQLRSQLDSQLDSNDLKYDYYVSVWWLCWLAFYEYAKEIGVSFTENILTLFSDVLDTFSINIFVGNVVFVCERPQVLWDNGMLSNDQKPAISWEDGTGFYYLDGVHFEKELWEKVVSKNMSLSEIMKIEISDQRTVALKYNPQAIIKEKANLVHKDDRNNELYLVENGEINDLTGYKKMYFVKMLCPTGRVFIEGIQPEEAEKTLNATDCQAYLCGLTKSEYMSMSMES